MLITESTVSPFVRGLPGSRGTSVAYGPRSTFEGSQDRSLGQLLPGVKVGSSLGQRGPAADHRPAYGYRGQHDWRVAAGENRSLSRRPVGHHSQAGCPERGTMTTPEHNRGSPARNGAVLLALRC